MKRRRYSYYPRRRRFGYRRRFFARRLRYFSRRVPLATRGFKGYEGRRVQEEKNYKDFEFNLNPTGITPTISLINGVAQGTGVSERVGRRICIKSVQIRGMLRTAYQSANVTSAVINISDAWRIMLIWDTQVNGVAPGITDILNGITSGTYFEALTNLNNRERFNILMDKTGNYSYTGGVPDDVTSQESTTSATHAFKKYKKLNHIVTFNSGTTDQVGSITTGALWLVCISTSFGLTSGVTTVWNVDTRIRYTDA